MNLSDARVDRLNSHLVSVAAVAAVLARLAASVLATATPRTRGHIGRNHRGD